MKIVRMAYVFYFYMVMHLHTRTSLSRNTKNMIGQ